MTLLHPLGTSIFAEATMDKTEGFEGWVIKYSFFTSFRMTSGLALRRAMFAQDKRGKSEDQLSQE
jgi:hypothetical protein